MKKFLFPILALLLAAACNPSLVQAKLLPQATKAVQKPTTTVAATKSINVSPRLRWDRRALIVYFSNLQNASSVSYSLTYNTSSQQEGAMGALSLSNSNTSTELLFGTCSKNVCRYHTGISNMRLEVSYTLKSGSKYLKRFKIKV